MEFNLADLLERVADTVPDHLALVVRDRRLTFAELDERANRLAHALAARGVGPGDHVALYLYNSTEYLEGMLAAFKLRAVPINVNYRYVEDELRYLLDDADAVAVVFHREFAPKLAAIRSSLPKLQAFICVADDSDGPETDLATDDYDARARGGHTRSRLRGPLGRRPVPALHRRDHRHAERRDVAPRRPVLRRDGGRRRRRDADPYAGRDRGALPRCAPTLRPDLPVHARHRALDGVQHLVHGRDGDHPGGAPPRRHGRVAARRPRAGELHRHRRRRVRAPAARRARHRRRAARSTCRACTSCCPAARSSRRR